MASPNLTLRYTYPTPAPDNISTLFYNTTGIPHVKCFIAGKLVIVGLADNDALEQHTSKQNSDLLANIGFKRVESPQSRAQRSIMAFRLNDILLTHNLDEIASEIAEKNYCEVEKVFMIRAKFPILKTILSSTTEADRLLTSGIKAFSIIIPSQNLEKEKHTSVSQCFRCYCFTHSTSDCPSTTLVCSKCAGSGHIFSNCTSQTTKCLNCEGPHVAVSLACPVKKEAKKQQQQHSASTTASAPTFVPASAIPVSNKSYANVTKPQQTASASTSRPLNVQADSSLLCVKVQACAAAAVALSGGDTDTFAAIYPLLLVDNGLPSIKISPQVLSMSKSSTTPLISAPSHAPASATATALPANHEAQNTPHPPEPPITAGPTLTVQVTKPGSRGTPRSPHLTPNKPSASSFPPTAPPSPSSSCPSASSSSSSPCEITVLSDNESPHSDQEAELNANSSHPDTPISNSTRSKKHL